MSGDASKVESPKVESTERSAGEQWQRADNRRRSRRLSAKVVRVGQALLYPLPLWLAMPLGEAAGTLAWMVSRRLRGLAGEHLDIAFGDSLSAGDRRRLIRRVFLQLGRSAAEVLVTRRIGVDAFAKARVTVEGVENLRNSLDGGKGAIALAAHFGNFEMLAAVTARSFDLRVVGRTKREEDPIGIIEEARERFGLVTLPQTQPRALLRALRQNAIVGILPDQDVDRLDGIFVPFFGRDAYTPTGPAAVSLATGAPMVPCFIRREGRSKHRLVWLKPIIPDKSAPDRDAEVRRLTEEWTRVFEEEIRARPDLWVWFHRRWQTTPESLKRARARRAEKQARRTRQQAEGATGSGDPPSS